MQVGKGCLRRVGEKFDELLQFAVALVFVERKISLRQSRKCRGCDSMHFADVVLLNVKL